MNLIYETATGRVVCVWEEGEYAAHPIPRADQTQLRIDATPDEFMAACRESAGLTGDVGVGNTFLHDTPQTASKSERTQGRGVKVGHKAVESNPPKPPQGIADRIQAKREANGTPLSTPVTLNELREAEREADGRALAE